MTKGFDEAEIEVHKHIAEMDWKNTKGRNDEIQSVIKDSL
jgi:hypothetical protein